MYKYRFESLLSLFFVILIDDVSALCLSLEALPFCFHSVCTVVQSHQYTGIPAFRLPCLPSAQLCVVCFLSVSLSQCCLMVFTFIFLTVWEFQLLFVTLLATYVFLCDEKT